MNKELTISIIKHVLANFMIIPSPFVSKNTKSLVDNNFILDKKIQFEDGDAENIYGAQINYNNQEVKIIFTCIDFNEYFLVIHLKNAPTYGLFLRSCQNPDERYPEIFYIDPLIVCSLDGKSWMECQTYLQATFLAAMEQIKDLQLSWNKCQNYAEEHECLISFIKFKENYFNFEDNNEG